MEENRAEDLLRLLRAGVDEWRNACDAYGESVAGGKMVLAFEGLDQHLKAGGDLPADWDVSAEVPYEAKARALVREGKKIQAIKEVRAATGWSLREAKDYVDSL